MKTKATGAFTMDTVKKAMEGIQITPPPIAPDTSCANCGQPRSFHFFLSNGPQMIGGGRNDGVLICKTSLFKEL